VFATECTIAEALTATQTLLLHHMHILQQCVAAAAAVAAVVRLCMHLLWVCCHRSSATAVTDTNSFDFANATTASVSAANFRTSPPMIVLLALVDFAVVAVVVVVVAVVVAVAAVATNFLILISQQCKGIWATDSIP